MQVAVASQSDSHLAIGQQIGCAGLLSMMIIFAVCVLAITIFQWTLWAGIISWGKQPVQGNLILGSFRVCTPIQERQQ